MKLLALCACDKVIIDKNGAHSLVTLLLKVDVFLPAQVQGQQVAQEIPQNAVIPKEWFIFTMWVPDDEDTGKSFEEAYQIFWPNGEKFGEHRIPFKFEDGVQQISFAMLGFPIGQVGNLKIITWVEQNGRPVTSPAEYLILIRHAEKLANAPAPLSVG
jgi:hypothetical protein